MQKNNLIKSQEEIATIKEGGVILGAILKRIAERVMPGISTASLNTFAEEEILKAGGTPAFKNYGPKRNPFPAALCTSINSMVVHGIPSEKDILKNGDIVGLDIGMEYKGFYTDTAVTVPVGKISNDIQKLLRVTKDSLDAGIAAARAGNTTGDIGYAVQSHVEAAGLAIVRDLVGHGVGYDVHEDPQVPNYGKPGTGLILEEGMVLAIEPMVTMGGYKLELEDDGWGIATRDGSLAAHFEHTVAIRSGKNAEILT